MAEVFWIGDGLCIIGDVKRYEVCGLRCGEEVIYDVKDSVTPCNPWLNKVNVMIRKTASHAFRSRNDRIVDQKR